MGSELGVRSTRVGGRTFSPRGLERERFGATRARVLSGGGWYLHVACASEPLITKESRVPDNCAGVVRSKLWREAAAGSGVDVEMAST